MLYNGNLSLYLYTVHLFRIIYKNTEIFHIQEVTFIYIKHKISKIHLN